LPLIIKVNLAHLMRAEAELEATPGTSGVGPSLGVRPSIRRSPQWTR
jgi:hypothetical protein